MGLSGTKAPGPKKHHSKNHHSGNHQSKGHRPVGRLTVENIRLHDQKYPEASLIVLRKDYKVACSHRPVSSIDSPSPRRRRRSGSRFARNRPRSRSPHKSSSHWTPPSQRRVPPGDLHGHHRSRSWSTHRTVTSASQHTDDDDSSRSKLTDRPSSAASQCNGNDTPAESDSRHQNARRTTDAPFPSITAASDESHLTFRERIIAANHRRIARAAHERALGIFDGPLARPDQEPATAKATATATTSTWLGVGGAARAKEARAKAGSLKDHSSEDHSGRKSGNGSSVGSALATTSTQPDSRALSMRPRDVMARAAEDWRRGLANASAVSMRPKYVTERLGTAAVGKLAPTSECGENDSEHLQNMTKEAQARDTQSRTGKHHRKSASKSREMHGDGARPRTSTKPIRAPKAVANKKVVIVRPEERRLRHAKDNSKGDRELHEQQSEVRRHCDEGREDEGYHESASQALSPQRSLPLDTSAPTNGAPKLTSRNNASDFEGGRENGWLKLTDATSLRKPVTECQCQTKQATSTHCSPPARENARPQMGDVAPSEQPKDAKQRLSLEKGNRPKPRLQDTTERIRPALTEAVLHMLSDQQRAEVVAEIAQSHAPDGQREVEFANSHALQLKLRQVHWWFSKVKHRPLSARVHEPWGDNSVKLLEQPDNEHGDISQDDSIRTLREIEFAETNTVAEPFRYKYEGRMTSMDDAPALPCLPKQFSSQEALEMFDFGIPKDDKSAQFPVKSDSALRASELNGAPPEHLAKQLPDPPVTDRLQSTSDGLGDRPRRNSRSPSPSRLQKAQEEPVSSILHTAGSGGSAFEKKSYSPPPEARHLVIGEESGVVAASGLIPSYSLNNRGGPTAAESSQSKDGYLIPSVPDLSWSPSSAEEEIRTPPGLHQRVQDGEDSETSSKLRPPLNPISDHTLPLPASKFSNTPKLYDNGILSSAELSVTPQPRLEEQKESLPSSGSGSGRNTSRAPIKRKPIGNSRGKSGLVTMEVVNKGKALSSNDDSETKALPAKAEGAQAVNRSVRQVWSYPRRRNMGRRPGLVTSKRVEQSPAGDEDFVRFSDEA